MAGPSYVVGRFYTALQVCRSAPLGRLRSTTVLRDSSPRAGQLAHTVPSLVLNSDQDLTIAMMATMMMMILFE